MRLEQAAGAGSTRQLLVNFWLRLSRAELGAGVVHSIEFNLSRRNVWVYVCVCLAGHLTLFRFNDAASRTG